jgi:transposase
MLKSDYYTEPKQIDKIIFKELIPEDHYLRKVKAVIDFEIFREKVRDCYSPNMGRGAEDPVRLIKLEFLKYQYGLSDREVIEGAMLNVGYRYFLDLSMGSKLPDPSLLSQFRTRIGHERYQVLFDEVVSQARAKGLVKDKLRIKDATHIIANIAIPSTIQLVAQTRKRLLESIRHYEPERVSKEEARADQIRQVTTDLKDEERLLHRVTHLQEIVLWADGLQRKLGSVTEPPDPLRERFEQALDLAHKVLNDREDKDKKDKVVSIVDPDVRTGKHTGYFNGYYLDVSMDGESEIITAIDVLAGNDDEAANAKNLIETEEKTHKNDISELSIDGNGWRGKLLRTLSDPDGLGLEVYVPPRERPSDSDRFTPDDFILNEDRTILRCPNGQLTSSRKRNNKDTGWMFTFSRSQCANCPLIELCLLKLPKNIGRSVIKNDYQSEYDAAFERSKTDRYSQVKKLHPKIERKISDIVFNHQGRRTRFRGRQRVKIQYLLTGMVVNIKRIVKLIDPIVSSPGTQPILAT